MPDNNEAKLIVLMGKLKSHDPMEQYKAAEELGWEGDKRAIDTQVSLLEDHDQDLRFCIAVALGQIGDIKAVVPLIEALKDTNIRLGANNCLT